MRRRIRTVRVERGPLTDEQLHNLRCTGKRINVLAKRAKQGKALVAGVSSYIRKTEVEVAPVMKWVKERGGR